MKKKTVGALLTGALVGVGVGVLFAPRKGSETRKLVSKKIDQLCKEVKELDYEEPTIRLDRPFLYMIVDNATNLPLLIGTVTSI